MLGRPYAAAGLRRRAGAFFAGAAGLAWPLRLRAASTLALSAAIRSVTWPMPSAGGDHLVPLELLLDQPHQRLAVLVVVLFGLEPLRQRLDQAVGHV